MTSPPKGWQGLPRLHEDFLGEILVLTVASRVHMGDPVEAVPVGRQNCQEHFFVFHANTLATRHGEDLLGQNGSPSSSV